MLRAALLLTLSCGGEDPPALPAPAPKPPTPAVGLHASGGYVGSEACATCHEATHASWHRSYHRTMTQRPTAEAILGRFDGAALDRAGHYRASRRGDAFVVTQPGEHGGLEEKPVELVTGSHHMQVYWVRSARGVLEAYAFAFLLPEQRWVPNEWTLLRPPATADALAGDRVDAVYTWNRVCVKCHVVDGVPGFDPASGEVSTTVAELGIACESCHGPGETHVQHWRGRTPDADALPHDDPTILDPREGGAARASQVCAQCHAISVFHDDASWVAGGRDDPPPAPITAWGRIIRHPLREHGAWTDALLDADPDFFAQRYWSDGEVRVSGREYNGLIESPCAVSPDFGCTTCHRMHQSSALVDGAPWQDDQLRAGARDGDTCARCHQAIAADPPRHAKHSPKDATCLDCHMPRTTYGLLGAIRSHTITVPNVEDTVVTGRPLACNLCHLDRTLGWSAQVLARDYHQTIPGSLGSDEEGEVPAAARWLIAGDAGQRALAAWHLGAAGTKAPAWAASTLDVVAASDPYPAVRLIAQRARERIAVGGVPAWLGALRSLRDDREVRLAE